MRRFLLVILALCLGMTNFASAATAQTGDSVTGQAQIIIRGLTFVDLSFDAHSGPSGEQPRGTVSGVAVTCLNVSGNQATVGLADGVLLFVEDNDGAGEDRLGAETRLSAPVTLCPDPAVVLATGLLVGPLAITSGDITAVDAPVLPTTKEQCKNGGWQSFGGAFKNQGDCVSFAATGGKQPLANSV
jgi:hypothetical protein